MSPWFCWATVRASNAQCREVTPAADLTVKPICWNPLTRDVVAPLPSILGRLVVVAPLIRKAATATRRTATAPRRTHRSLRSSVPGAAMAAHGCSSRRPPSGPTVEPDHLLGRGGQLAGHRGTGQRAGYLADQVVALLRRGEAVAADVAGEGGHGLDRLGLQRGVPA